MGSKRLIDGVSWFLVAVIALCVAMYFTAHHERHGGVCAFVSAGVFAAVVFNGIREIARQAARQGEGREEEQGE